MKKRDLVLIAPRTAEDIARAIDQGLGRDTGRPRHQECAPARRHHRRAHRDRHRHLRRPHRRHLWQPIAARARSTARGRFAVPGFIDTHLHVESSLVTPLEFDRCVLPHGVTTAICDPHEIANVLGAEGIRYLPRLRRARRSWTCASSSPPACRRPHLETSGARCEPRDLLPLRDHPEGDRPRRVHELPRRARAAIRRASTSSSPSRTAISTAMRRCCAARPQRLSRRRHPHRPRDDHRRRGAREARARAWRSSSAKARSRKDLHALRRDPRREHVAASSRFCTDDRNPLDIAEEGHLDFMIRTADRARRGRCITSIAPPSCRRRAPSACATAAWSRRAGAPTSCWSTTSRPARCSTVIAAGRVVDDALFAARATVAPVGLDSVKARAGDARRISACPARPADDAGDRRRAGPDHHRAPCAIAVPASGSERRADLGAATSSRSR